MREKARGRDIPAIFSIAKQRLAPSRGPCCTAPAGTLQSQRLLAAGPAKMRRSATLVARSQHPGSPRFTNVELNKAGVAKVLPTMHYYVLRTLLQHEAMKAPSFSMTRMLRSTRPSSPPEAGHY